MKNKIGECYRRYKHGKPAATHGWGYNTKFQSTNFLKKKSQIIRNDGWAQH